MTGRSIGDAYTVQAPSPSQPAPLPWADLRDQMGPLIRNIRAQRPDSDTPPAAVQGANDPVMQALLQQLEYTKQAPATVGTQAGKVVSLPAQQGGGSSAGLIVLVVVVVAVGGFYMVKKAKNHAPHERKGVTHVES